MRAAICAFLFGFASSASMAATPSPPPVFPPGDTVDTIHGVQVRDPYRALENGDDPQVKAWSDAENARTRAYLDALPGRAAVAAKLMRLIKAASASYTSLQARGERIFALYSDPARQQPWLVTLAASADPGTRKSLVDPNAMDPGGHIAIDWYVPSPDGALAAVSLSRNGSEDGTLHIYDVATGAEIGEPISRVQYPTAGGALAWTADGKGFWYTRYPGDDAPEAERHFNIAVYFHRLRAPLASDTLVLSKKDGVPRTGEVFLDNRAGGHAVLASVQLGDGGQWQQFVLREGQPPLKIAAYEDRIIAGAIAKDGTVYGLSRKGAPAGKVLKLSAPYAGGFAAARQIIAPMEAAAIVDGGEFGSPLSVTDAHLFVTRIVGGPVEVDAYDLDGGHPMKLSTPPVAAVNEVDPLPNGDALYSVMTYLDPPFFMRWSAATGGAERTGLAMTSPVSYADATVTRAFATSKDGAKVPLNIIAKKDVKLDGSNPVLLYGYGGYGVNMTPSFSGGFRRMWLDAGGIYVVANLRGGGEYGDRWHREGMLTHKQNVFDDFAAAGETLIKLGYTNHDEAGVDGRLERRPAHGRCHRPASEARPRRRVGGRHLRHDALRARSQRRLQHLGVRQHQRSRAVQGALRLFPGPPRRPGDRLSGGADGDGGQRRPREPDEFPQVHRAAPGGPGRQGPPDPAADLTEQRPWHRHITRRTYCRDHRRPDVPVRPDRHERGRGGEVSPDSGGAGVTPAPPGRPRTSSAWRRRAFR